MYTLPPISSAATRAWNVSAGGFAWPTPAPVTVCWMRRSTRRSIEHGQGLKVAGQEKSPSSSIGSTKRNY